ncbi:hypothetical protein D3C75_1306480 [compost metagenome]
MATAYRPTRFAFVKPASAGLPGTGNLYLWAPGLHGGSQISSQGSGVRFRPLPSGKLRHCGTE